jgi:glycyl-tRNA synthetase
MESIFEANGLMFWSEREIRLRRQFAEHFSKTLYDILLETNPAWRFIEVEAPLLTPRKFINQNYTNEDIWVQEHVEGEELVLRPETTPGSYAAAGHLLRHHTGIKPPFVVWQSGKSFRREADQVTKNMRLKEFYQQEFQCIYAADTLNDYLSAILTPVCNMLGEVVGYPTRIVESDRLPSYSEVTMDVEVDNGDKWMEICSISKRLDFPHKARFNTKKGLVEKDLLVLEIAIGLDRCVYNFQKRSGAL